MNVQWSQLRSKTALETQTSLLAKLVLCLWLKSEQVLSTLKKCLCTRGLKGSDSLWVKVGSCFYSHSSDQKSDRDYESYPSQYSPRGAKLQMQLLIPEPVLFPYNFTKYVLCGATAWKP